MNLVKSVCRVIPKYYVGREPNCGSFCGLVWAVKNVGKTHIYCIRVIGKQIAL